MQRSQDMGEPDGAGLTVPLEQFLHELAAGHGDALVSAEAAAAIELFVGALAAQPQRVDSSWSRLLGPVATSRTVSELLRRSRRWLEGARRSGEILGVKTASGRWVYPLRQFRLTSGGHVAVRQRLDEVLRALYVSGDAAGAARWLATPNRLLGGKSPWVALDDRDWAGAVVVAAESQAAAWAAR